jgi:hypothetical protein
MSSDLINLALQLTLQDTSSNSRFSNTATHLSEKLLSSVIIQKMHEPDHQRTELELSGNTAMQQTLKALTELCNPQNSVQSMFDKYAMYSRRGIPLQ